MNVASFLRTFLLVALSMAAGRFVRENPLLFDCKATSMPFATATATGFSSSATERQPGGDNKSFVPANTIITSHPVLDAVLKHHEDDIVGDDYDAYRNHW
jgi:hypothetical protein